MKLRLTDGKSQFTIHFDERMDFKDCATIRESKQPISKAMALAKKRMGVVSGVFPIPVNALEGL